MNSTRSQIVDLTDPMLKTTGWDALEKPALVNPEDCVITMHVTRDFSIYDESVPEKFRGKFMGFHSG
jgi:pullulanase/glycogen debranching enzyme